MLVCTCVPRGLGVCAHKCPSTGVASVILGHCVQDFPGGAVATGRSIGQGHESGLGTAVWLVSSTFAEPV